MRAKKEKKFKVKSDLILFEMLQKFGKISNRKLSKVAKLPTSTIEYAYNRLKKRDFYDIKAIPRLDLFPEVPMTILGFPDIDSNKLRKLRKKYLKRKQVRLFLYGQKQVVLFLMSSDKDKLTNLIFEIMEDIKDKPCIHLIAPRILKFDLTIPNMILEKVYSRLPDRRGK